MRNATLSVMKPLIISLLVGLLISCEKSSQDSAVAEITYESVHTFQGLPDGQFGNQDGSVLIDIKPDITTFKDVSRGLLIQPDGKVLIYGDAANPYATGPTDAFIARLNTDGSLDTSFNTTGIHVFNSSYNRRDYISDIKILNNFIYAFGSSRTTHLSDSALLTVLRFNLNGTLDLSFGTNGVSFLPIQTSYGLKSAVASDGSIYVLSYSIPATGRQYFVTKINHDGTIDTSFGVNGLYTYSTGINYTEGDIVVDKNGKILTTFTAGADSNTHKTIILRLNQDGSIDTSFATNGVYIVNYGMKNYSRNIVFYKDDILVNIVSTSDGTNWGGVILKLDQSGTPVSSWGTNGLIDYLNNNIGQPLTIMQMRIYRDKIIVVGDDANNFKLAAIDAQTGLIDTRFAGNGIYVSSAATPSFKGSWLQIDETNKTIWISGNAETTSTNQKIHVSKFK